MISDNELFGMTVAQQMEEESREAAWMYASLPRSMPLSTYEPHPVEEYIEDIALGLTDENPIVLFLFSYNRIIIGEQQWSLSREEWKRARHYCRRHATEGLAVDSFYQGGIAFQFMTACRNRRKKHENQQGKTA
jgi:hypothetical protein